MQALLHPGTRVEVPFRNKTCTGIVARVHTQPPKGYSVKPILAIPDHLDIVNTQQLAFWEWMAAYYMCPVGDVMHAALPAPYKLSSETIIVPGEKTDIQSEALDDKEYIVAEALSVQKELSLHDVQKMLQQKSVQPVIRALIAKGIAAVREEIRDTFRPRKEKRIALAPPYRDEKALESLFAGLEKYPRQLDLLMLFYQLSPGLEPVEKKILLRKASSSPSVLQTLVRKGIFIEQEEVVSRVALATGGIVPEEAVLSPAQEQALAEICNAFAEKETVLLHGVTGSGKTELYMELIRGQLDAGKQVLYLLPEIALTAQIINRLKKRFGALAGVYHSKFSQNERVEIWNHVMNRSFRLLLGARSSVFLPFTELGLVIVDEEHDYSYKQQEPDPRYHARDAALYLARLHGAKALLGTATPSLETYHHAVTGKYGLVHLADRHANMDMPEIRVVDIREQMQKKTMHSHFSAPLLEEIRAAMERKEQVILFQNRRGYSPHILCEKCGWIPKCVHCDVHLVYHKYDDELRCHYCGYKEHTYTVCPACGSARIVVSGFGTEKLEDELQVFFPEKHIARLDLDAVKTKHGHEKVIHAFEEGGIDILVGTQMVTKGLDFDHVSLVGIMSADQLLNFSDFRAHERAYQMLTQVAGRSGRKNRRGLVLIQTYQPHHPVIRDVVEHDYKSMYAREVGERKKFSYPPFTRLIRITLKHKEAVKASATAELLAKKLRNALGDRVLGPAVPGIPRIKNKYLFELLIKAGIRSDGINACKQAIRTALRQLEGDPGHRRTGIVIDVDPC